MANHTLLSASSLEGDQVKNRQGEDLGEIKEIMIDTETHSVAYYVLSFGGVMGIGDDLFAIPPEAMRVDTAEKCFILNVDKKLLKSAEGFDKNNWPDLTDPKFRQDLYGHYGISQSAQQRH
ncbi:PRC-barrel domain containing protein [Microbulbifer sp. SH-1]|uniref:PRC-barrel domain-containing protein n=1 Tax=Microbulbifer sp. SH-1 TaxID=2681547 RepID=UPI001407B450|nr:PRC-barrel domain-containing protein [Microbulbifer sp. SH-1]QIL88702.1 PRC-barrel domain containing protein [Microbulbifer sp. SH-1]